MAKTVLTETDKRELEKLVNSIPLSTLERPARYKPLTKKHAQTPPRLMEKKTKGRFYYSYRLAYNKLEYLGDADYLRALVKADKAKVKA